MKEHFDIGAAIFEMRQGRKVAREGWNGKNQHLGLQYPDEHSGIDADLSMTQPFVYITTVTGDRVPWLASQTDLLADDWFVVE